MSSRGRLLWLGGAFLACGITLAVRLVYFQIVLHDEFVAKGQETHRQQLTIPARRGDILDRSGSPLAITVSYGVVQIDAGQVEDPDNVARTLAPLLELRPEDVRAKIDKSNKQSVVLKAGVPAATMHAIDEWRLPGVVLTSAQSRRYAEGSLAARVLGFVGTDYQGLAGIELQYDDELAGAPGRLDTDLDTHGQEIVLGRRVRVAPRDGADLVLTIDRFVQRTAERLLAEAVVANKATGGVIMVMEPSTGGVLASATLPTYSLTDEALFRPETTPLHKAAEVTDQFEPGSILKVLTMAAGLNEGVVRPETVVNDTGVVSVNGVEVRNWNLVGNGLINMTELLIRSSNIGAQYVAGQLGPERFYHYFEQFGFGQRTGVDLPGEVPGMMRTPAAAHWNRLDLVTNSFGQGIALTPMQVITAVAGVGNDGLMMQPRFVREIRRPDGVESVDPRPVRQIVSPYTAQVLRGMMVHVIEQKALDQYRIPGYRTAGKTGTADFATVGGYKSGKTFASVVALAPAAEPRFAILIRLDAPEAIYGGRVAVPVLAGLLPELYAYYRVPPSDIVPGGQ